MAPFVLIPALVEEFPAGFGSIPSLTLRPMASTRKIVTRSDDWAVAGRLGGLGGLEGGWKPAQAELKLRADSSETPLVINRLRSVSVGPEGRS